MFCSQCGASIPDNANFCDHCGAPQTAYAQPTPNPGPEVQQAQKPAKKSKKKIIGIILLCLQAVSLLGTIASGDFSSLTGFFTNGAYGIGEMLGFFSPTIIGVILLVSAQRKK